MFKGDLFVLEMCRRPDRGGLNRALNELWILNFDIIHNLLSPLDPIVPVGSDVTEINAVFISKAPLSRTREILLDIDDPQWRNATPAVPRAYIWRGEEKHIRLHPSPDAQYELWALVQRSPVQYFPRWFHLLAAIRASETLSESEPVVGRLKMAEFMRAWREAFSGISQ